MQATSRIGSGNSNPRTVRRAAAALAALFVALQAAAVLAADPPAAAPRPRIGLVLGGGGARGAAHIGVLKVLEEMRIPVDYVVGTSMGSIVGGLYASGLNSQEIEQEMLSMDWNDLFQDEPSRADRSFRRKSDDYFYTFEAKLGFNAGKLNIPLAYIRGQKLDLELNRLTLPVADVKDFNRLPIPYRAVATDIATGKPVVLASGNLSKSIRASMAVPAAFDPVEINGRLLVDGGISNNVPVNVARDMGADVLIVVDVGTGLYKRREITSALSMTGQLANYLFTLNTEQQLKTLGSGDVLIRPQLGDIGGSGFDRVAEAIPIGERAARAALESLQRYSLSPEAYAQYVAQRTRPRQGPPLIDRVRIDNQSQVGDAVIAERISAMPGQALDVKRLEEDIGQVYGLGIFESVRYDVVREDDKNVLVITAKEKGWGPGYLQFGLAASNNFDGDNRIKLGALYTRTELNALSGEWRVGAQVGDEPGIFTELHQPLDPLSRYFVNGRLGYGNTNHYIFDAAGNRLSVYQLTTTNLNLAAGREFGTWGEVRLGYHRETGQAQVISGVSAPEQDVDLGDIFLRLSDDKLDNVNFPRDGHFGKVEYRVAREGLGASNDYDQGTVEYVHAFPWNRNTLIARIYGLGTVYGTAPLGAQAQLGGFLRLSGLQEDQLSGQDAALASLVYMHRIVDIKFFTTYLGASLELGNVWQDSKSVSVDDTVTAGSVFLGMDTPIGPVYFALGHTDTGESSFYLYLGPRFSF